jgi:23S rRNA (guanine745-N1)-methyltransferase
VEERDPACRQPWSPPSLAARRQALARVTEYLRCPICAGELRLAGSRLTCDHRHSFDIARHGYVNLGVGRVSPGTGDTPAMIGARHSFLSRGHYQPLAEAVRSLATRYCTGESGLVIDLAGGTGYYLSAVLDVLPNRYGLCVDLSAPALRRAAQAHARAAALGADVWKPLPLVDRSAILVLNVFGPRNADETSRILARNGTLLMAAPGPAHLHELQQPLGMLNVDPRKSERITSAYRDYAQASNTTVSYGLSLDHADLAALVSMGPSAHHISPPALAARIRSLPTPATVTVDVRITAFQLRERSSAARAGGVELR